MSGDLHCESGDKTSRYIAENSQSASLLRVGARQNISMASLTLLLNMSSSPVRIEKEDISKVWRPDNFRWSPTTLVDALVIATCSLNLIPKGLAVSPMQKSSQPLHWTSTFLLSLGVGFFEVDQISGGFGPSEKGWGGGGGWRVADHPDPEIRQEGLGPVSKKFFLSLRDSVWSKNKGEWGASRTPLDPPMKKLPDVLKSLLNVPAPYFLKTFVSLSLHCLRW